MPRPRQPVFLISAVLSAALIALSLLPDHFTRAQSTPARIVGSATVVAANSITVQPDHGAAVTLTVGAGARILETQPGAKTLAGATAIPLSAIAPGDRVLAITGSASAGSGLTATAIIVMKAAAIAERQKAEEAEWQKNGAGGLVKSVNPTTGEIVLTSVLRTVTITTTPSTVFRRYSPNSIAFAASTPSTLAAIRPDDQLRARGQSAPEDGRMTAVAVVFGAFRNIAATILSTDPAADTLTVQDLKTKKPVVIHITAESRMHRIPERMARFLAMRLKRLNAAAGGGHEPGAPELAAQEHGAPRTSARASVSEILARTPTVTLAELKKGQALMIVATEGRPGSATAITLLAGVEPILTAPPAAAASMFSASWNVGGSPPQAAAAEPGVGTGGTP